MISNEVSPYPTTSGTYLKDPAWPFATVCMVGSRPRPFSSTLASSCRIFDCPSIIFHGAWGLVGESLLSFEEILKHSHISNALREIKVLIDYIMLYIIVL